MRRLVYTFVVCKPLKTGTGFLALWPINVYKTVHVKTRLVSNQYLYVSRTTLSCIYVVNREWDGGEKEREIDLTYTVALTITIP